MESYAKVFDEEGALDKLEGFASEHGPRFYGLPLNKGEVELERTPVDVPDVIDAVDERLKPFMAGEILQWRIAESLQKD